ncbi:hypothetical protein ES702_04147 [subsurface metagenome]
MDRGLSAPFAAEGEDEEDHHEHADEGSSTLRAALYIASVSCIKHNRELSSLYLKKISQGKEAKQALVCVGKKLAYIMYSILKNGSSYDPQRVFLQV